MSIVSTVFGGNQKLSDSVNGLNIAIINLSRGALANGAPNEIITNAPDGSMTSIAILDPARGGTGLNTSASTGIVRVTSGNWSTGSVVDADLANGITRSKLAASTPNTVVVNDGSGLLTETTWLSPALGGTGIDTSALSGVAKISSGVWSVGGIVNAEVAIGAGIDRSKLAAGSPNHVVINSGGGALTSEATLSVLRGGTGADFSGVGTGPFSLELSSGVYSTVPVTALATANTHVSRDALASSAFNSLSANTLASAGALQINAGTNVNFTANVINTGPSVITATPSGVTGGNSSTYVNKVTTVNNSPTPILTLPTVQGPMSGTTYTLWILLAAGDQTGGSATATITFKTKAKNVGGVVSVSGVNQILRIREIPINAVDANVSVSGQNVLVNVIGVNARTINWSSRVIVVSQQF